MKTALFHMKLDADVVVTERFAAQGSYPGLPFLPGNLFLGVVAGRLYKGLSSTDAFTAFHSGQVRFGAAYPVFGGSPALPVPFSWFAPKGEAAALVSKENPPASKKDTPDSEKQNVVNMLRHQKKEGETVDDPKFKQLREGYFTLNGTLDKPPSGYRLKTAIEREEGGRAKDSQLFGYEHLSAGSDWWFTVSADASVDDKLFQSVADAIEGRIRIGRSRAAEYGAATVHRVPGGMGAFPSSAPESSGVVLYCLSDLALSDPETGNPTVMPCGAHFGIPSLEFDPGHSYLRTRIYTTFNGKRGAADLERQAVERGSVLAFKSNLPLSTEQVDALRKAGSAGVGMYRQEGLGQFLVEPSFLSGEQFGASAFEVKGLEFEKVSRQLPGAAAGLVGWLQERRGSSGLRRQADEIVEGWVAFLLAQVQAFKSDAPGNSQWSRLRDLPETIGSANQLVMALEKICDHGVSGKAWSSRFQYKEQWVSFADFLVGEKLVPDPKNPSAPKREISVALKECGNEFTLYRECVRMLGERMAHAINQNKGNGGVE